MSNFVAGGCSFTFGHELSDDQEGKHPSRQTWAHRLYLQGKSGGQYICVARAGSGNCLLYTSPSPRDATLSRMPSSA